MLLGATQPKKPRPTGARKPGIKSRETPAPDEKGTGHRPPVTHGYFKSFDDTKLFYSVEGKGPPLVFCYGLVCSSLHWTYQIEHFRKNYRTIWFDYRGHQNSETPRELRSLTIQNIACDLGHLLDELGIAEAVLLGHSMGVNVVLDLYRQRPEKVKGMVLANGTAMRPLENMFRMNAFQAGFRLLRRAYDASPRGLRAAWKLQKRNPFLKSLISLGGFNAHLTPEEDIDLYVRQVAEMDPAILIHLIENYEAYDATAWLHTVAAPTLILAGENDMMTPVRQQELMRQLIPGAQLEVLRHGSHCPQMDLPELVNVKIERFLAGIGQPASETVTGT